jgi:hypothetical protein
MLLHQIFRRVFRRPGRCGMQERILFVKQCFVNKLSLLQLGLNKEQEEYHLNWIHMQERNE